ncbi:MAG TPA: hypothetical protein VIX15_00010, partial [Streptosporangiaceae bacterium]
MSATDAEFEYVDEYNDGDDWVSEQDTTAIDSEDDGSGWHETRQRTRPERAARQVPSPGWPREARRYVAREPELPLEEEPAPTRQATRRAGDPGARARGSTAPRATRRVVDDDPGDEVGRATPRAARRSVAHDVIDDPAPPRPRAARRAVDRDLLDDDDRVVPRAARYTVDPEESYRSAPTAPRPARRSNQGARSGSPGHGRLVDERTQVLIAQGRRGARARLTRARNITVGLTIGVALAIVLSMVVFRKGAAWPPSVTVVQSEITTACQNPNVASEPNQVNFACGKGTSQVLWVFALMTSGNDANFADAKSGRKGLEPITEAEGGEVAWSLDLHHPYDPFNSIDSLEVAARAINNIVGGASLTAGNGKPAVQPGLLSNPTNCAKYTGSAAVIARAGFPDICASPLSSAAGQAALVADIY